MKKLYRSALFAGVLALGVAACGDDVTIVEPEPTPPPPLSVTLTPSNQSIGVGAVADFAVGVTGGATGTQASWTCSSSASGVASVATTDTGCRATGVAAGNASITVTVTKGNQSANAGAQVTVTSVTVAPATITIASIQQGGEPVDIENISGQIDVTLNVNPRDETIQRVVLYVDGVEVASQVFTSAMADMSADEIAEALQQITLSFRTDFYTINEAAGTATPRHMNGDRVISAALEVVGADANRPSNTVPVRFNNTSGFHVKTNLTENNSATDSQGRIWYGGDDFSTTITAFPVLFDGGDVASVTMNFCGTSTDTTAPYTFTRTCADIEAMGLAPTFSSVVAGNTGPTAILNNTARFGLSAHPFPVRIDRVAPQGGAIVITQIPSVGNRANWVRGDYSFAAGYTAPTDTGVGLPTPAGSERTFRVRQGTTVIETGVTTPSPLANSLTNEVYNVQAVVQDRLGNSRVISQTAVGTVNPLATFGVDKNVPEVQWDTMTANTFRSDTTTVDVASASDTALFNFQAMDNLSGFAQTDALTRTGMEHNLVRVTGNYLASPTALNREILVAGTGAAVGATPFATVAGGTFVAVVPAQVTTYNHSPTLITNSLDFGAVATEPGYYIYQVRARDQAGNTSPILARLVYVNDGESPTIVQELQTAISLPWAGGDDIEFQAVADDEVEILSTSFGLQYPGIFGVDLTVWNDVTPVESDGMKFTDIITRPQFLTFNTGSLIRSLTGVGGDDIPVATAPSRPNMAVGHVHSGFPSVERPWQTGTGISATTAGISAQQVAAPDADTWNDIDFGDPATNNMGWVLTVTNQTGDDADNRTVTGYVQARGLASTFTNPFAAVAIVEREGTNVRVLALANITPTDGFPFADDGVRRDFRWTFTVSGVAAGNEIHAVGLNATSDGLVTAGVPVTAP
ncbi:MAG: hypothetical protein EA350_16675 [Gemmatimonadales bacterium]|nr:MAG: hypothetical protein EA350_16675 [Gemmatimonadales bacterium]